MQHLPGSSTDRWSDEFTLYALTDPAVIANPYEWYESLRRFGPIYLDETVGWVCTGFPECEWILRNEKQFQVIPPVPPGADADLIAHFGQQMIFLDANGVEHRHIRSLLAQRLLSKKSNDHWQDYLTQAARDLLMPMKGQGRQEIDLVGEYAGRLPTLLTLELLGLPQQDRTQLMCWNEAYESLLSLPSGDVEGALLMMKQETEYFSHVIAERRHHLGDDLISDMIRGNLPDQQINANCIVLAAGGYETTTHLISMAVYWLSQFPDQLRLLRNDPALIASALREVMRYDGSSQFLARRTKVDLSIGGQAIPTGQTVYMLLAAANRDGRQFPDPDRFDIKRPISRHLGFGAGRHACLGGPLAERLSELAVQIFLDLFPDYHVTVRYEDLPWKVMHSNVRCVEHLPVRLQASK
jgi:cytochrome P450